MKNDLKPGRRISETFDNGLPNLRKDKIINKQNNNPVVELDLDEIIDNSNKLLTKNGSIIRT